MNRIFEASGCAPIPESDVSFTQSETEAATVLHRRTDVATPHVSKMSFHVKCVECYVNASQEIKTH